MIKSEKLDEAQSLIDGMAKDGDGAKAPIVPAVDAQADAKQKEAKAELDKQKAEIKESAERIKAHEEKLAIRDCKDTLKEALQGSKLPIPIKEKIAKTYSGKIFKEEELKEAIKAERETLAKLFDSSSMLDIGDEIIDFSVRSPIDRLQCSLDLTLGHKPTDAEKDSYKGVDRFNSLREAYVAFTDDPSITGVMGPAALKRLQEATTSTFTYALGYTMNRRMINDYAALPATWREICNVVSARDFKMVEVIQWGGFGVMPTVQAARTSPWTPVDSATPTYPELGFPADSEATYGVGTKGGMVTVTRRMIIDDDLKILTKLPGKLAQAANSTLNQFVFDKLINISSGTINGGTIYDSVALFATAHGNYQTTAFGYDALQALLDKMWYQVEVGYATAVTDNPLTSGATTINVTGGTGDYIKAGDLLICEGELIRVTSVTTDALTVVRGQFGTTGAQHAQTTVIQKATRFLGIDKPKLWVPRGLLAKALELKTSDKNPEAAENATNVIKESFTIGGNGACPYLQGDENNYYLTAAPSQVEGIEIGFLNGKEEPEILVQDNPVMGNVFVYDTIRYKVRHEYGGCVVDYRGLAGSIVA